MDTDCDHDETDWDLDAEMRAEEEMERRRELADQAADAGAQAFPGGPTDMGRPDQPSEIERRDFQHAMENAQERRGLLGCADMYCDGPDGHDGPHYQWVPE